MKLADKHPQTSQNPRQLAPFQFSQKGALSQSAGFVSLQLGTLGPVDPTEKRCSGPPVLADGEGATWVLQTREPAQHLCFRPFGSRAAPMAIVSANDQFIRSQWLQIPPRP